MKTLLCLFVILAGSLCCAVAASQPAIGGTELIKAANGHGTNYTNHAGLHIPSTNNNGKEFVWQAGIIYSNLTLRYPTNGFAGIADPVLIVIPASISGVGGNHTGQLGWVSASSFSGGSQTPWTSDIDGAQFALTNALYVTAGTFVEITNSYVSGAYGSYSGGVLDYSTDSYISSENGSFSGGFAQSAINAYISSESGSFSGGYLYASDGSYIESGKGSFSGGSLQASQNSYVDSERGSFSGGDLDDSDGSAMSSMAGSFSGGNFNAANFVSLNTSDGSFGGANFNNSDSVSLNVNSGFGYLYAPLKTNISITIDRSIVVGSPSNEFTASFESTVAVIAQSGGVTGFDTNRFFGRTATLSNMPGSGPFVAADTGGNLFRTNGASHLYGFTNPPPTIAAGAGAGTLPTVSISGSDTAGYISITSGTLPSVSAVIATVTFGSAYLDAPSVVLWPRNAAASVLTFLPYAVGGTTTWTFNAGSVGLGGSTTYEYNYHVIGTGKH